MRIVATIALLALANTSAAVAVAQQYPDRPIRVVVPYGPGQATDVMCRVFLEQLKVELKQTIVIENRVGAASNIGAGEAAKAKPDGYTLLCTGNATHVANPLIYSNMGFNPDTDLMPITGVAATGYVMAIGPNLKGKTVKDVVALAKSASQPLRIGLASTTSRVLYGMVREAAKIDLTNVPYMGGNQNLVPDLMRGDTDLIIEAMPSAMGAVTGGSVTAIGVTLPERSNLLPDVPTLKESGVDVTLVGWNAFYAPRGTPPEIIKKLNAAAVEALKHPDVAKRLETVACVPMPTTPEQLAKMIQADRAKWKPMVDLYKLKVN